MVYLGLRYGSYEEYFDNGNSEWQGAYKGGQWDGPSKWGYKNGQLRLEMTHRDGKLHGAYIGYHRCYEN